MVTSVKSGHNCKNWSQQSLKQLQVAKGEKWPWLLRNGHNSNEVIAAEALVTTVTSLVLTETRRGHNIKGVVLRVQSDPMTAARGHNSKDLPEG